MSFPKYPEYKDSGIEWLGEVPAHWVVGPLRWYATIQGGVAKGKSYSDGTPTVDLPYLRVANVQDGHVDLSSVNTVTVALSEVGRYRLQPGDVLMNEGGDNDKLGRGAVWQGEIADCLHQNHVFAIRPNHHLLPYWLSMFTRSSAARSYFYLYSKQSTNLASISSSNVMSCPLPIPPQEEQRQVLRFLDHETARIDALVEEQKHLIELLKEKRQAVISHAVTKGLEPDVPMKGSGVEWLGEVPVHWKVGKIKWYISTASGGTPPSSQQEKFYDGNVPWLRSLDLNDGEITEHEVSVTEMALKETSCRMVPKGSVLIAMYGGDGTIGKNGLLTFDSSINQAVCAFLPNERFSPSYLHRYLQFYRPYWMIGAESSRKDPNIGQDRIGDSYCLLPPIEEQAAIVDRLNTKLYVMIQLQDEAEELVSRLQERRSALISAAVTGKIDVCGWQPPVGSSAPTETTHTEAV